MNEKFVFKYKSLSYLLWAILGSFGAHRLYLRKTRSGLLIAAFSILTTSMILVLPALFPELSLNAYDKISLGLAIPLWLVLIYDLFNIHNWANEINRDYVHNAILRRRTL